MTDFYAQLEQQLVAAAARRRSERGRVRRALAGRGRPLAGAVALAVAVAAVAVAAVALPQRDAAHRSGPAAPAAPVVPAPSASTDLRGIRVAVLNGTTQTGVARATADLLASMHARIMGVGNAPRQNVATTEVRHRRGARAKALRVAAVLGVNRVGPKTGSLPNPERAEVIVLVGADRLGRPRPGPRPPVPSPPKRGTPQAVTP